MVQVLEKSAREFVVGRVNEKRGGADQRENRNQRSGDAAGDIVVIPTVETASRGRMELVAAVVDGLAAGRGSSRRWTPRLPSAQPATTLARSHCSVRTWISVARVNSATEPDSA